ncbi:DNA primase family protein [Solidesulfovibrio sp.]
MAGRKRDDIESIEVQMRSRRDAEQAQYAQDKPDPSAVTPDFLAACAEDGERGAAEIFRRLYMTWDGVSNTDQYKNRLLFCPDPNLGWHWWDGCHWNPDQSMRVLEAMDGVVKVLREESNQQSRLAGRAKKEGDADAKKTAEHRSRSMWKMAKQLNGTRVRSSVLRQAAAGRDSPPWDRNPWLLPVANGVVDLKTGALRTGHPADYLRAGAPVSYDPAATCPIFSTFLQEILEGDGEMVDYLLRVLGYSLTGLAIHHKIWIFCGRGRNGKGTLLELMKDLLGPLATPIQTEMLLEQKFSRSSSAATPDVVDLMGKRLVWASETGENRRFSTDVIKRLTGADTLKGRPLQGSMMEIRPTHKMFVLANEQPNAPASDQAFWDRAVVVNFNLRFVEGDPQAPNERKMDVDLPRKLTLEMPGILTLLVQGCLKWQQDGIAPPAKVVTAVNDYRTSMDDLGRFLNDDCAHVVGAKVKAGELFAQYEKWAKTNGISRPWTSIRFGREMRARGIKQEFDKRLYYWIDMEIRDEFNEKRCLGWAGF